MAGGVLCVYITARVGPRVAVLPESRWGGAGRAADTRLVEWAAGGRFRAVLCTPARCCAGSLWLWMDLYLEAAAAGARCSGR